VTIAPATLYKMSWDKNTNANPVMNIFHGDIRTLISKDGPRSGMAVRTKTSSMGIRGTDFFASQKNDGQSKLSVLPGKMPLKYTKGGGSQDINSGFSGTAGKPGGLKIPQISLMNKNELLSIDQLSKVTKPTGADPSVDSYEKQASAGVMNDVKGYSPTLYDSL